MTSNSTRLNGSMTLCVWAVGDNRWGSGNLAIQIDLSPDDGATWINHGVYTADTIQQIEMYGVLLRAEVVEVEAIEVLEVVEAPKAASWWARWRNTPPEPVVPAPVPVVLSAALYGPARSENEHWRIMFHRGGGDERTLVAANEAAPAPKPYAAASETPAGNTRKDFTPS